MGGREDLSEKGRGAKKNAEENKRRKRWGEKGNVSSFPEHHLWGGREVLFRE